MDEIKQRLKDATDACITTYEAWRGKTNDVGAREALQEAVHELRKVAARVEIELAVSDRKHSNEPIPIPSHRASRRPGGQDADGGDDDNRANRQPGNSRGDVRERDGNRGGAGRPVQIRRPQGDAQPAAPTAAPTAASAAPSADAAQPAAQPAPAQPGNEAGDDEAPRKRPLSLKRGSADSE